ncbi:ABC transporter ATP-binding protein [Brevibacillus humidisoli]|uniref:ABC transporter ATP-binding protein n=1 Tax=Brevibacillus humidisoli TaxID=2895522 RepID=UPI001E562DD5|nr:ABC transporter ATP-binding protein [Brevibacillus humidisoli]UFJ42321.1 ABC transporter ATP-binding protein [Brevibacillus humidisoli]
MALLNKLSFHEVSFTYGAEPIVERLSFSVEQGEFVSLIGPSGVGKSTLFRLASGLVEPTAGTILLDGEQRLTRLGQVGYMPQKDLLMPWRTITENAMLPLELRSVPKGVARAKVEEQLPLFGLSGYADAYPDQLSGGMRQRVSLLRATLTGADLLLLDEPFSALDGITRMEMQEWLLTMWQELSLTIVMITHDIEEALVLSDRVILLREKPIREIVEVNPPLPRERERLARRHDPQIGAVRQEIWELLQSQKQLARVQGRFA